MNAMIDALLANGCTQPHDNKNHRRHLRGPDCPAVQLLHWLRKPRRARQPTGAGILIVDGNMSISGNLKFEGLILVRGESTIGGHDTTTGTTGSCEIYGSIWTENVKLDVRGSGEVYYSSDGLRLANMISGGNLPTPIQVTSLADCNVVKAGTGGC